MSLYQDYILYFSNLIYTKLQILSRYSLTKENVFLVFHTVVTLLIWFISCIMMLNRWGLTESLCRIPIEVEISSVSWWFSDMWANVLWFRCFTIYYHSWNLGESRLSHKNKFLCLICIFRKIHFFGENSRCHCYL